MVRRAREISNTRHNSKDCFEPPDHQIFWWFSYSENKQEFENEIENINRRRNAMRHNHHRRPRRDEMRRIEQQHDVYVKFFTIRKSHRLGSYVYNEWGKHTDKRYRNMQ